jgi:hypothetical protein
MAAIGNAEHSEIELFNTCLRKFDEATVLGSLSQRVLSTVMPFLPQVQTRTTHGTQSGYFRFPCFPLVGYSILPDAKYQEEVFAFFTIARNRDSCVGIKVGYGLGGPGSILGNDLFSTASRTTLGSTVSKQVTAAGS